MAGEDDNNKEDPDGDDDSEEDEDSYGELLQRPARRQLQLQLQPLNDTGKTQRQGILKAWHGLACINNESSGPLYKYTIMTLM